MYVIRRKGVNNFLSRSTAAEMGLVKRIRKVHNAFGEHGMLKMGPAKLELKDNAAPYAVRTARRVPKRSSVNGQRPWIGGVLLQLHGEDWKPVAYCSRMWTDVEIRHTQIEKECLGLREV